MAYKGKQKKSSSCLQKRNQLCKDQPNVNHLDVGCGRKTLCNTYEQSGQNQKRSQIDRDDSFKEEILEKIGGINDDEDDEGWKVNSE